jgi:tetratricopeptide (TPR) repeat protein
MSILSNISSSYKSKSDGANKAQEQIFIIKIKRLLESEDSKNIEIAFQLLSGLSDWSSLTSFCLGLALFHTNLKIKNQARSFVNTKFSEEILNWLLTEEQFLPKNEIEAYTFLQKINQFSFININEITLLSVRHQRLGVKYALEEQVLPAQEVLSILAHGDWLSLENKELKTLPKEIGNFTQLNTLNISGNHFTHLPDEISNLTNLNSLYFSRTPLSRYTLKQLQGLFPNIFAEKFYMQAVSYLDERNYHDALQSIDKSLKLNPLSVNALHGKGIIFQKTSCYKESIHCFEKALSIYDQDPQIWANLALSLMEENNYESALKATQKGIYTIQQSRQNGSNWLDVLYLYQGQALISLERFEEAHLSLGKSLKFNPDTGSAWYQKAIAFALTSEFDLLYESLKTAIELNRRFLREAQQESIFLNFKYQDKLKKLLKLK